MKNIYPIETTYAYSHADQYHAPRSWKPRMLRPLGITSLLFCIIVVVGLLEGAARTLPHRANPLFNAFLNKTESILNDDNRLLRRQASELASSGDASLQLGDSVQIDDGDSGQGPTSAPPATDFLGDGGTFSAPLAPPPPPTDFLGNGGGIFTQPSQQTPPAAGGVNGAVPGGADPVPPPVVTGQPPGSDFIDSNGEATQTISEAPPPSDFIGGAGPAEIISPPDPGEPPVSDYVGSDANVITQPVENGSGLGSRPTVTQTYTVTAIMNRQNPWFNPALFPPQKDTGPFILYVVVTKWPRWAGFLGSGACAVIVLAALQGVWSILYSQIILIEPFASMATPKGASAKDALFAKYAKQSLLLGPFKGLRSQRWVYFLASLAAILSTILPSLGSEVLLTDTHSCDESPPGYDLKGKNPCPPQLMVNIQAIRALQIILGVIGIILITIGILLHLRQTNGISSDPSSIDMVASLLHHPETLRILRSMPPDATSREMKKILGAYHFKLAAYESADGTWRYGIIPVEQFTPIEELKRRSSSVKWNESTWFMWLHDTFLAVILLGLLGVILAYYIITNYDDKFYLFFAGQSFGARFVLTGTGSVIAALWHNIFSEVDVKSIFAQLSRGRARAENTVLAKRSSTATTSIIPSLIRGRYFASLVALTDLLTLVLVIALPGIPLRSGMTQIEYRICTFVSMAVIGIILVVLLSTAIWRRRLPRWPRQPDCLASIMTYLIDSDLILHYHRATEIGQSGESATATIKHSQWAFDRCVGPDGLVRWSVIEDKGTTLMTTPGSADYHLPYQYRESIQYPYHDPGSN